MRSFVLVLALSLLACAASAQKCQRSYDEFDQVLEIMCNPVEATYLEDDRRPTPKVAALWSGESDSYAIMLRLFLEAGDQVDFVTARKADLIVDEWRGTRTVEVDLDGYVYILLPLDNALLQRIAQANTVKLRVVGWPFDVSGVTSQVTRLLEMRKERVSKGRQERAVQESEQDTVTSRGAPYEVKGLDRDPERAPLPEYINQVNAQIRVRITVNPEGRIVARFPLRKGNPKLEAAVMQALQNWNFNALPPGAPQENQTGIITFSFRLR